MNSTALAAAGRVLLRHQRRVRTLSFEVAVDLAERLALVGREGGDEDEADDVVAASRRW